MCIRDRWITVRINLLWCYIIFINQSYKYQEDYPNAIKGYEMASKLDPEWNQPKDELEALKQRLKTSVDSIENKVNHSLSLIYWMEWLIPCMFKGQDHCEKLG